MDRSSGRADRAPTPPRTRESGVVLILAMLVLLLLMVIVPTFILSARVERELAFNEVAELQMEATARAAMLRAQAGLLIDLEDDKSGEEEGDDPLGGGGGGGSSPLGGGAGGGGASGMGPGGGDAGGGSGNHVDSLDEPWAEGTLDFPLGEEADLKTRIYITDEDSKLNVLLLAAEEVEYRREWRSRFERSLDLMRDGLPEDLSTSDAGELLDRIERWMRGERGNDQIDKPKLQTGNWHGLSDQPTYAPLSLSELALAGGMPPKLQSGFLYGEPDDEPEDKKWVPGLAQTFTVWSNVEWKDLEKAEETANAPPVGGKQARPEAQGVNNGRININTAPVWVLKGLFPDSEIPYSAWDEYEKFRREQLDEIRKKREEARAGEKAFADDKPDESAAKYPFKTIDDLRKVEGFSPSSSSITPQRWDKLAMLLTVESNVFTITVVVATMRPEVRFYVARSVVWRRSQGGGEPRCLPIVAFERIPVASIDLREFEADLEEDSRYLADE